MIVDRLVQTPADVKVWIEEIRALAEDPEAAHIEEDTLHQAVLAAIADGRAIGGSEMCDLALSTLDIDFDRWYA